MGLFPLKEQKARVEICKRIAIPDPEKLLDGNKGGRRLSSLWCFATDARDPNARRYDRSAFVVRFDVSTNFKKIAFIYKKESAVSMMNSDTLLIATFCQLGHKWCMLQIYISWQND